MFADSRQRAASREPDLADLDLHRIDLAARLLAHKHPAHTPEGLISAAAGTCSADAIDGDPVGVGLFIAELVRHSDAGPGVLDSDRALFAAERLAELLAALTEPGDLATIRALRRGGARERPLPLPSQRRIRRACLRLRRAPANASTLEPLPGALWDELLADLARSLAFDREAELWADVASDGLDEADLLRVRAQVRGAIARGARAPVPWSVSIVASRTSAETSSTGAWPPRERDLLPAGHRVGRFTLLQRLGVGAMGVVYSAVDPELDRRIAVKLLRAPSGPRAARAHARLLREAQAMARVTHPNVAVVHEVGTHDGDVFVAMELVRGVTLQAWLKHKPRTWREVVEVFMQAARGLAAAHAAGLVHRDFKPSNAMLGDDGRVRVLDFGLCFTGGPTEGNDSDATETSHTGDLRNTQREEIVGTPAYMPPEQFIRGGVAGPASDQFSFCASLYEGLYAQLPFAGQTVAEVTQAIALGQLRPPPRGTRVPGWLFAVLQRGLKPDPELRFPSMAAMMRALDRGRARARASLALATVLATVLATGLGGFWAAHTQGRASDPCSGGVARIAEVWSPTQQAAAARAMTAAGPAFASEIWPRVSDQLGRYADDWQLAHRDACQAHRRGETSDTLLDRRMACLEQRRAALGEAVTILAEPDPDVALHALAVVSRLPGLARCDDLVLLAAEVPPPTDPAVLTAIAELRPRLARVQALEHAGQPHAAARLADELVTAAESVPDRGLLAETLLTRGRLEINRLDRPSDQEAVLGRAFLTAFGGRQDELATEALALRMYARSRAPGRAPLALDDLALARELLARLPSAGRVRGLVLNNAGAVHLASGDRPQAASLFREALTEREATLGRDHLEVAFTLVNLAMVGAADERIPLLRRALEILDRQLGQAHPQTLEARLAASMLLQDPREARAMIAPGCAALARFAPGDRTRRARCEAVLGHHAAEAGDHRTAGSAFLTADSLLATADPTSLRMTTSELAEIRGRAALYTGEHRDAIALLRAGLAELSDSDEWWQRLRRAELSLLLGLHLEKTLDPAAATNALTLAVTDFERASAEAPDILQQQRLASARAALAAHLLADPTTQGRAAELLTAAERWYRDAGPGYTWRLGPLGSLRRRIDAVQ